MRTSDVVLAGEPAHVAMVAAAGVRARVAMHDVGGDGAEAVGVDLTRLREREDKRSDRE